MWRRDLAIALGARLTWAIAALGALVVGHGFVLALGIFTATSRATEVGLDPLAGIVRPTFGGVELATALLVPIVAARVLSVEKERNTFGALAIAAGGADRILGPKLFASILAAMPLVLTPAMLFVAYCVGGGKLDLFESLVPFFGHALHVVLVATTAFAAAAWTKTTAQATTLALVASLGSWSIEAGDGFAALAWLAPLDAFAVGRHLAPFDAAIVEDCAVVWFLVAIAGAVALAWLGLRFDLRGRVAVAIGVMLLTAIALLATAHIRGAHDWTEASRASLPPAAIAELRALDAPIAIEVWLDRDDARRRQLERDTLMKLRLARPDVHVTTPLDDRDLSPFVHDEEYGRVIVHVGGAIRETRSTSRREIVTLIFEAAGRSLPNWTQPEYRGHPFVGSTRGARFVAYALLPSLFLVVAWAVRRRRKVS